MDKPVFHDLGFADDDESCRSCGVGHGGTSSRGFDRVEIRRESGSPQPREERAERGCEVRTIVARMVQLAPRTSASRHNTRGYCVTQRRRLVFEGFAAEDCAAQKIIGRSSSSSSSCKSTTTGTWSLGASPLRWSRSMRASTTLSARPAEPRMKSMRSPSLRGKRSCL